MKIWPVALAVACIGGAVLVGNYHVLTGDAVGGLKVIPKVSWSLSESFVNVDALGNMPAIFARAQYPLLMVALAKMGRLAGSEKDLSDVRSKVQIGMTESQVYSSFGYPTEKQPIGPHFEHWVYRAPLAGQYVTVSFEDGRVTNITD